MNLDYKADLKNYIYTKMIKTSMGTYIFDIFQVTKEKKMIKIFFTNNNSRTSSQPLTIFQDEMEIFLKTLIEIKPLVD